MVASLNRQNLASLCTGHKRASTALLTRQAGIQLADPAAPVSPSVKWRQWDPACSQSSVFDSVIALLLRQAPRDPAVMSDALG